MGLRLKFNIILTALFLLGLVASAAAANRLLRDAAREETVRNAELMLQMAISVRDYTVSQIKPQSQRALGTGIFTADRASVRRDRDTQTTAAGIPGL